MPSRKAEKIVGILRSEILSGQRAPGEKLPTYDALIEQFAITRPTVARVVRELRKEGLIEVNGTRRIFVASSFPHHGRYLWVTSEQPGSIEWTCFMATILELIERGETGIEGEIIPLVGVDGRANNPAYQRLCDAVNHGLGRGSVPDELRDGLSPPGAPGAGAAARRDLGAPAACRAHPARRRQPARSRRRPAAEEGTARRRHLASRPQLGARAKVPREARLPEGSRVGASSRSRRLRADDRAPVRSHRPPRRGFPDGRQPRRALSSRPQTRPAQGGPRCLRAGPLQLAEADRSRGGGRAHRVRRPRGVDGCEGVHRRAARRRELSHAHRPAALRERAHAAVAPQGRRAKRGSFIRPSPCARARP